MKKIIPICLITFLADRISKHLIVSSLKVGKSVTIIKNFFSITLAKNTGIAFSLLEGKIGIIILLTILMILLLLEMLKKENKEKEKICYAVIIGGAIGNLLDRLLYGYVIDFLDFKIFGYDYPIFNIADSCIVIGIILLLIISFTEKGENYESNSRARKNKN